MKQEPYLFPLPPHISQTKLNNILNNILNLYQNFYKDKYFKDEELGHLSITAIGFEDIYIDKKFMTISNNQIYIDKTLKLFFIFNNLFLKKFKESLFLKKTNHPEININLSYSCYFKKLTFEFKYELRNIKGERALIYVDYEILNNILIISIVKKRMVIKHKINVDCSETIIKNLLNSILYVHII